MRYVLLALALIASLLFFYHLGSTVYKGAALAQNLSSTPTSTPRPQLLRLIQEAMKHHPRPTPPSEQADESLEQDRSS